MIAHLVRIAAQKLHHRVVAQVEIPGAAQIDDASERYRPAHRIVMSGKSKRELSAGRVSQNENSFGINWILARKLAKELIAGSYVFEAPGPASAGVADAPVFEVPGHHAGLGERGAEKARVL